MIMIYLIPHRPMAPYYCPSVIHVQQLQRDVLLILFIEYEIHNIPLLGNWIFTTSNNQSSQIVGMLNLLPPYYLIDFFLTRSTT